MAGRSRRISFSAQPAAVVITESPAEGGPSLELQAKVAEQYGATAEQHGSVEMGDLPHMLQALGLGGDVNDFMQRQKVVQQGAGGIVSEAEFHELAGGFEEYSLQGGGGGAGASSSASTEFSPSLAAKLEDFFGKIDVDGDGSVTLDEAVNFWGQNFARVNATAMFKEVDADGDGSISFDEWIGFWKNVLAHGYSADDLEEEVEMLLEGNSWVDFNDGRSTGTDAGT